MNQKDKAALMAAHDIFKTLPQEALADLAARAEAVQFPAGTLLFQQGDPGDCCYLILQGKVRVHMNETDGKELLVVQLENGDLLGEIALLDGGCRTASATTATSLHALILRQQDFQEILLAHSASLLPLLRLLCARLRATDAQLTAIALKDLPARLAGYLLHQASRCGQKASEGVQMPLGMTQGDLADHLATSRESVNKLLNAWQARGLINLLPSRAILVQDTQGLQLIAKQN